MRRFGMTIRLKPGSANSYKRYHAAVWPEVLDKILECNIKNYSIYLKDDVVFSYFEYHGSDMNVRRARGTKELEIRGFPDSCRTRTPHVRKRVYQEFCKQS
jgi:L-rhamnose mutarotase